MMADSSPHATGTNLLRRPNSVSLTALVVPAAIGVAATSSWGQPFAAIVGVVVGLVAMQSPQVAQQWERAIILRLGRFHSMQGPGLFWIVPFFDRVASWIDQRTITTTFAAEQTLTSDTVP